MVIEGAVRAVIEGTVRAVIEGAVRARALEETGSVKCKVRGCMIRIAEEGGRCCNCCGWLGSLFVVSAHARACEV